MRLLRKIANYAEVTWSGVILDDEIGARIPSEIAEGTVKSVMLTIRNTAAVTGGTPRIVACWTATETSALNFDDAAAITEQGILGLLNTTNNAGAGVLKACLTDDGAETCVVAMMYDVDWHYDCGLPPWVGFAWEVVATGGTSIVDAYLYGTPRQYSDVSGVGRTVDAAA